MSGAITYTLHTVLRYTNKTFALLVLLFYLLNPNTVNLFMHPVKDNAFAIGTLFLTVFSINIFFLKANGCESRFMSSYTFLYFPVQKVNLQDLTLIPHILSEKCIIPKIAYHLLYLSVPGSDPQGRRHGKAFEGLLKRYFGK